MTYRSKIKKKNLSAYRFWDCPNCGYVVSRIEIEYAIMDFDCVRCGQYKLSQFIPSKFEQERMKKMDKEHWIRVGKYLQEMIQAGFFPGIGYDEEQWTCWVFLKKTDGDMEKLYSHDNYKIAQGRTLLEAVLLVRNSVCEGIVFLGGNDDTD